jgi:hypothetical protein
MPAFCGSPITPNRTSFDPSQDGVTKQCRSLSLGGMCSPGALAGTTGVHTEVITGDWQQKITGSATVTIQGNSDTTVQGKSDTTVHGDVTEQFDQNCKKTVSSNDTLKVHGNSTTVVNGSEHNTTLGPTLETRIGEHTEVHQAEEHNQDLFHLATHSTQHDVFVERFEADGVLVCPIGFHGDLVGARLTAGVAINEYRVWGTHVKGLHNEDHELSAELKNIKAEINDLKGDLTPVTIKVNPTRVVITELYVIAGPPVVGSILDALIAEFALAAAI